MNTTRDGGKTFEVEPHEMIFGIYFFLSTDKVERFKLVSNISNVIAIMGGLVGLIY